MARTPTSARRSRVDDEDHDNNEQDTQDEPSKRALSPRKRVTLANHLLEKVQLPQLGGPPKSDEEKLKVLRALAYLKSSGRTNRECSELLDVSERTINNYLADEAYTNVQGELQAEAKEQGHTSILLLAQEAIAELYTLMKTDRSGFVRFKSAEALLNFGGYNVPREEQKKDGRSEVERFLTLLRERESGHTIVNVQVNTPAARSEGINVIESEATEIKEIPEELAQYYQPVQAGGLMPGATRGQAPKHKQAPDSLPSPSS